MDNAERVETNKTNTWKANVIITQPVGEQWNLSS